jgi:acyl carrier protein
MITASSLSNNTLTIVLDNGKQILSATKDHPHWADLINAYTDKAEAKLLELLSMKRIVEKFSRGGLVVSDTGVFYQDMPLSGVDVDRVLAFMRQNLPYTSIANYMVRKLANTSRRAIHEMYNFLEKGNIPLTDEGYITAYKGVKRDFYSVTSGKEPLVCGKRNEDGQIFNGVGEVISMDRKWVDDDFRNGCSGGLHAGSLNYARDWAHQHTGIIILIEIDPADVVSVPADCDCNKLRCCRYKVVGTFDGPLPDTYTSDYSTKDPISAEDSTEEDNKGTTCAECGDINCDVCHEDEECNDCGNPIDYCDCDTETSEDSVGATPTPAQPSEVEAALKAPPVPVEAELHIPTKPNPNATDLAFFDPVLRRKFNEIICDQLGTHSGHVFTDEDNFSTTLGADSLDLVELVMAMEEEFHIEVPDSVAESIQTVGQGFNALTRLIDQKNALNAPTPVQSAYTETDVPWIEEKAKIEDESTVTAGDMPATPTTTPTPPPNEDELLTVYNEGYEIGNRHGTRRVRRVYRVGEELEVKTPIDAKFIQGYNEGYRAARWDYA